MIPKAVEVGAQCVDARGIQLVEPPASLGTIHDQMRVFQDPQVLRDRGPAHGETACEFAHRLGPLEEALEDRSAGRVAQSIQLLRMLVSNH